MTAQINKTSAGATLIDGNLVAEKIQTQIAQKLKNHTDKKITLATVLIGNDPASNLYVGMKQKCAAAVGINSKHIELPETVSMQQATDEITALVNDPTVHGILIQLPLPEHLDTHQLIDLLPADKDVDGLCKENLGNLVRNQTGLVPCTPQGVMRLLENYGIVIAGKRAVVIGRSTLVGLPQVLLLTRKGVDATATLAHSRTLNLQAITRTADIIVAAAGIAKLIRAEHIKPGATVIDVGVTRTKNGIQGDVDFENVQKIAGAITPMPGGTGPMTVACLLENTVRAAKLQNII